MFDRRLDQSISQPEHGSLFKFNRHTPLGKMQRAVAEAYGVAAAIPSTNGTTSLNVLALLSLCEPGDEILAQRDSHCSLWQGMVTGDLRPTYLEPHYNEYLGLNLGISPAALDRAVERHPEVRLVFLTCPNYFGVVTDIEGCVEVCQSHGKTLIVDAAHGPHLRFHPSLPVAAEEVGADVVNQSTHKICGALSQGSLMLVNDEALLPRLMEGVNSFGLVSTSFSYPILVSLEEAVAELKDRGRERLAAAIELSELARERINRIHGLACFGLLKQEGFRELDPTRLTVDVSRTGLTGFEFEDRLIELGVYPEMASMKNAVFIVTIGNTEEHITRLLDALKTVVGSVGTRSPREGGGEAAASSPRIPPLPQMALTPREAFYTSRRRGARANVEEAVGLISAETVACYPPGSPVLCAGELITADIVEFLSHMRAAGATLKGATDPVGFKTIRVIPRAY